MPLQEGLIVADRYRLVRSLRAGGMASVWVAHDTLLDAACALKLVDDERRDSAEVRIRFKREAKVAAQLRGPHVVHVFDHGVWDGIPFMAMELLEGEDLAERLHRLGPLDGASTQRIVAQVARALARAHALGIVHRDLKPENVFLVSTDDGEMVKVLDFGIAHHHEYSLRDKTTKTGSFLGTPYYMSPEQARGDAVDHRSDLWSLAVITWECLLGKPPFESEVLGRLFGMIMYDPLPVPSQVSSTLPAEFDDWWQRASARNRDERFQSAKELSDALALALHIERPTSVPSVLPQTGEFVQQTPVGTRAPQPSNSRTPHPVSRTSIVPPNIIKPKRRYHVLAAIVASFALGALAFNRVHNSTVDAAMPSAGSTLRSSAAGASVDTRPAEPRPEPVVAPTANDVIAVEQLPRVDHPKPAKGVTQRRAEPAKSGKVRPRPVRPDRLKPSQVQVNKPDDSADYGI